MLFEFLDQNDEIFDNNLFNVTDGLEHGNMFKSLYEPYKNYKVSKITPKTELENLMLHIQKYSFALNDLNLYLDIHPNDKEAYQLFLKYNLEYRKYLEEYERKYYILNLIDDTNGIYTWSITPWPWEGNNV